MNYRRRAVSNAQTSKHESHDVPRSKNSFKYLFGIAVLYVILQIVMFTAFHSNGAREGEQRQHISVPDGSSYAKEKDDDDRPLFVLHVGAPKTGTTTIQCTLGGGEIGALLEQDNYYFIGKNHCLEPEGKAWAEPFMDYILFRTIRQTSRAMKDSKYKVKGRGVKCHNENCWGKFLAFLQSHKEQHHNIIVSDEAISYKGQGEFPWDLLKSALDGWRVKVIVTYRRYHEWYPSIYNQKYKATGIVDDTVGFKKMMWPGEGGLKIKSISDLFYREVVRGKKQLYDPSAYDAVRNFEKHYNVSVLNFHDNGEIVTNFVCKMLPGADKACEFSMANINSVRNPSFPLHYDMLAVEAHEKKLVKKNVSRATVREAVREHQEETLGLLAQDFPLDCFDTDLKEKMFEISLKHEKYVFPEKFVSNSAEAEHKYREIFEESFLKNALCSVDVHKVLSDKEWLKFLGSLREPDKEN